MNALSFRVLRRLGDGEFHSGAALAHAFGVSRGTIWNAIRAIEAADFVVYKVSGRGYRLAQPLSFLDGAAIARRIGARASRVAIEIVDQSESTNTALLAAAAAGKPSGHVLAAEWQTHGRGRLGRTWVAGACRALTFSVLWRFSEGAASLAGLSLAAGVAVVRALERCGASDVLLKWPNDVLHKRRKLAGILIEMQGDALGPTAAVIGIGINVRLSESVKRRIAQPATDLETICGEAVDRSRVLGVTLDEVIQVLDRFTAEGFAPLRHEWQARHAHQDSAIEVKLPDGSTDRGIARGVAADGALLLETPRGVRRLHSGEVSVRALRRERAAA